MRLIATLRAAFAAGCELKLEGGQVICLSPKPLTPALRQALTHHKPALLALLTDPNNGEVSGALLAVTVQNILELSPAERDQYRRDLDDAAPNDPWLAHDLAALRRAEAVLHAGADTAEHHAA